MYLTTIIDLARAEFAQHEAANARQPEETEMPTKPNPLKQEPEGLTYRSGCKVHWRTYATKDQAEAAAEIARHNARIAERIGFDSGFQTPGVITATPDGHEVCFL